MFHDCTKHRKIDAGIQNKNFAVKYVQKSKRL